MIRKNVLFCKLNHIKISSLALFQSFMNSFRPQDEECPVCHSTGNCRIHSYYDRNLIDFFHGRTRYLTVKVLRVICTSCGHTHAILPDLIIPYSTYGLTFILHVLNDHFSKRFSIQQVCEKYAISPPMLYRWQALFLLHKDLWLGVLESAVLQPAVFLEQLCSVESASGFFLNFFQLTGFSFLQCHSG